MVLARPPRIKETIIHTHTVKNQSCVGSVMCVRVYMCVVLYTSHVCPATGLPDNRCCMRCRESHTSRASHAVLACDRDARDATQPTAHARLAAHPNPRTRCISGAPTAAIPPCYRPVPPSCSPAVPLGAPAEVTRPSRALSIPITAPRHALCSPPPAATARAAPPRSASPAARPPPT